MGEFVCSVPREKNIYKHAGAPSISGVPGLCPPQRDALFFIPSLCVVHPRQYVVTLLNNTFICYRLQRPRHARLVSLKILLSLEAIRIYTDK